MSLEKSVGYQQCFVSINKRVSEELKYQLDTLKQNKEERLVLTGSKLRDEESNEDLQREIETVFNECEVVTDLDDISNEVKEVYRMGPKKDGFQNIVIKFKRKSIKKAVYQNRKKLAGKLKVLPYLTNYRQRTLNDCKSIAEKYEKVDALVKV